MIMERIGILGAGTWGVALARMLCIKGHDVTVWSALPEEIESLSKTRQHPNLPSSNIPDDIVFTSDIEEAVKGMRIVVFAVPSVFIRSTSRTAAPYIEKGQILVNVSKGIEEGTFKSMTEIMGEEITTPGIYLVALSGPTHAEEVSRDMPTTIIAACEDQGVAGIVADAFRGENMKVYTDTDVKGIELCGALKNVIALAAGISAGMGYGDNARAALIARGMAEIASLGVKMGCSSSSFWGLAGIGDLIVTATSVHSRNNKCGYLMGQGMSCEDATREVGMVVEGINALPAALSLAQKYDVKMPIIEAVDDIVKGRKTPSEVVRFLMDS